MSAVKRIPVTEQVWKDLTEMRSAGQTYTDLLADMIEDRKKWRLEEDVTKWSSRKKRGLRLTERDSGLNFNWCSDMGNINLVRLLRPFPFRKNFCFPEKKCIVSKENVFFLKYTVVLEPQEEGGFTVQCVEIPGAISQGWDPYRSTCQYQGSNRTGSGNAAERSEQDISRNASRDLRSWSGRCRITSRSLS